MARLFVAPERMHASELTLSGEDHHYLSRVLRLRSGDTLVLFDGQGHEAVAKIQSIGPRAVELAVVERREAQTPAGPKLSLLVALPKGEKMDLVVQKATELGAARIVPVHTARSIPAGEGRLARWRKIAREAARQSGRSDVPEVAAPVALAEALFAVSGSALRLLFWEDARTQRLRDVLPAEPPGEIVLLTGPEGGFDAAEVATARQRGFLVVGLGPRTLRAETAAIAALAICGYALGDLS